MHPYLKVRILQVLKLVWPDFVWPLLTGGHYSEVVVNTGLIVYVCGAKIKKRGYNNFLLKTLLTKGASEREKEGVSERERRQSK